MSKKQGAAKIPASYRLLYTEMEIEREVARIGAEITDWAGEVNAKSGKDIIAIPLLRGGIFFFGSLMVHVRSSVELVSARTKMYTPGQNNVQLKDVEITLDGVDMGGRSVLLVDDLCDSGKTLRAMQEHLLKAGATEVRTAVLAKRILATESFEPTWIGFEYKGPEWFVGFGLDDCNRWSNLPSIYVIEGTGKSS